ncbi:MAG: hypothetical protein HKO94_09345, partial [Flavobacteriaceae bacterium]|nr:hypothetical protein [Flavobacteriaceae bacterium]
MNMVISQETFKIMFYNVLNFPDQGPVNRIDNLAYILQDYQPDIFMICELNNEQGANDILGVLQTLKPSYSKANFVLNTSDDADGDQNFLQNI